VTRDTNVTLDGAGGLDRQGWICHKVGRADSWGEAAARSDVAVDQKGGPRGQEVSICLLPTNIQWIGLREKLQENPIFSGKICGFL